MIAVHAIHGKPYEQGEYAIETLLTLLDYFFFLFHSFILGFNLSGWAWRKTRRAHLYLVSLTAFSWFILGIWYGWGYCPCTDWHWEVKRRLGQHGLPNSYIKYLLDSIFGTDLNAEILDLAVGIIFFFLVFISILLNYRDWKHDRGI
jgi:hypothetical protein